MGCRLGTGSRLTSGGFSGLTGLWPQEVCFQWARGLVVHQPSGCVQVVPSSFLLAVAKPPFPCLYSGVRCGANDSARARWLRLCWQRLCHCHLTDSAPRLPGWWTPSVLEISHEGHFNLPHWLRPVQGWAWQFETAHLSHTAGGCWGTFPSLCCVRVNIFSPSPGSLC